MAAIYIYTLENLPIGIYDILLNHVGHQRYISTFYMFIVQVIRSTVLQSKRPKLFSLMVDLHINKVYKVRLNSCCACPN